MAKIIFNPTDAKVSITIDGHDFSVDAKSEILMEVDAQADFWKKTHEFLEIRGTVASAPKVKEVVEEVVEAPVEAPIESPEFPVEEEEAPKVKKAKK